MSFPPGTEMFQFPGFAFNPYGFRAKYFVQGPDIRGQAIRNNPDTRPLTSDPWKWVPPFGNFRIKAPSQLPGTYRSVARPSSPARAKASTERPYCT